MLYFNRSQQDVIVFAWPVMPHDDIIFKIDNTGHVKILIYQTLIIDKYFRIFKIRYEKVLVGSKFSVHDAFLE